MKLARLSILLSFLLSPLAEAWAAIAHVQTPAGGANCGSATSCGVIFGVNVTAGSLIVAACRYGTNGRTETMTDTLTNTYAKAIEEEQANDGNGTLMIWYAMNSGAGADTVTCTIDGAAAIMRATTSEFSGAATTNALDKTASAEGTSAAPASGNVTPDSNGQLLFATGFASNVETFTAGTDFTINTAVPAADGTQRLASERFIQATAAAHNGDFTIINADRNWAAAIATFREAGAAAAPQPIRRRFFQRR